MEIEDKIFVDASHKLKSPLVVIFGAIHFLEHYLSNAHMNAIREKAAYTIRIIKQYCFILSKLTNNIADTIGMYSGRHRLNLKNEDIVKVINDIVLSVSGFIGVRDISMNFETSIEEMIIPFDVEMVERVMLNLISNAIRVSDTGSRIHIKISDVGNFVEISVSATGVGDHAKVQEITAAEGEMGLSIARSIVDLHRGKLSSENRSGNGNTTKFYLPSRTMEAINTSEPIVA